MLRAAAAVTVAGTVLVAGCGKAKKPITRLEYAQRADAICAPYNQQTAQLRGRGSGVEALATVAEKTLQLLDRATARLHALPLPRGGEALARRWLASLDRLRTDVVRIRDAARANDLAAVREAALKAQRDDDGSNELARRLGLQACSAG